MANKPTKPYIHEEISYIDGDYHSKIVTETH